MLTFKLTDGKVTEIVPADAVKDWSTVVSRNDWKTLADAEAVAAGATELTGDAYVATDTANTSPRFDVVRVPKVGDEISYAFNGDYYPDGVVAKVSPTFSRVTSSTGRIYTRVRNTGTWRNARTWSLVQGHISRQNPSF